MEILLGRAAGTLEETLTGQDQEATGDEEIQDKLIRNIRKEIGESYNNLTRELREEDINPNNTKKLVDVFDDIPELKEVRPNYDYNIDAVKHTRVLTCVAGALVVFGACSQLM